jgi:hypothetical protein
MQQMQRAYWTPVPGKPGRTSNSRKIALAVIPLSLSPTHAHPRLVSGCPSGGRGRPFVRMPASSISTSSGLLDTDDHSCRMRAAPEPASLPAGAGALARRALAQSAGRSHTIAISARAAIGTVRHILRRWRAPGIERGLTPRRRREGRAQARPALQAANCEAFPANSATALPAATFRAPIPGLLRHGAISAGILHHSPRPSRRP